MKAASKPLRRASSTSARFASSNWGPRRRMSAAMARSARFLVSAEAQASTRAAVRAARPSSRM